MEAPPSAKGRRDNGHAFEPLIEEDGDDSGRTDLRRSQERTSAMGAHRRSTGSDEYGMDNSNPFSTNGRQSYSSGRLREVDVSAAEDYELSGNGSVGFGEKPDAAEMQRRRTKWFKEVAITAVFVLLWYLFATLLSLYNKWMFSPAYYGFSYPLFVTMTHMFVQFCLAAVVRVVFAERYRPKESPSWRDYGTKVVPTAVATGADIGLSNLSLKTITLSLYTMCKSSALIFVLGFAFLFHLEPFSLRLVSVISLITVGVFLMVFNATAVSIPGIIMVFMASALGGLRWALTQLLMHKRAMGMGNPFATIFWLSPVMGLALAIVSMIFEGWFAILRSDFFATMGSTISTIGFIVFPGTLAFSMVASEYFIIQRAGIVPLSIAGIFKEVTTITISAWVFGDELTPVNDVGVVVTIGGIALYSFHKYQKEMQTPSHRSVDAESMPMSDHERATSESDGRGTHHIIGDEDDGIDGDVPFSAHANGHADHRDLVSRPGKRQIRESEELLGDIQGEADLLEDDPRTSRRRSREDSPPAYRSGA